MKILFIILLYLMIISNSKSDNLWWPNVGVKFGWNLDKKGYHFGPEISITKEFNFSWNSKSGPYHGRKENSIIGLFLNFDFYSDGRFIINPGVEVQVYLFPGICVGPSIITKDKKTDVGINFGMYHGVIIYPYISYSWYSIDNSIYDAGTSIKIPLGNFPKYSMNFGRFGGF